MQWIPQDVPQVIPQVIPQVLRNVLRNAPWAENGVNRGFAEVLAQKPM